MKGYRDNDLRKIRSWRFFVLYQFNMLRYSYTAQVLTWADSQAKPYGGERAM